jgi:DNA repair protein RecN (Recombination protein N)
MLLELHIRNIALVDDLCVEFSPGLNILTGETGAGKSVIVGALLQVLGERADAKSIREGADSALVEASFDCTQLNSLRKELTTRGVEIEDDILVLRREVSAGGRNKCYLNGQITTLAFLKEIGDHLVDIHSQNDHQTLLRKPSHLDFLDGYGGFMPDRARVLELYQKLAALRKELEQLSSDEKEKERTREMNAFYLKEIDGAKLQPGEEEELRDRKRVLANTETLHDLLTRAFEELAEDDTSALTRIRAAARVLAEAEGIDKALGDASGLLEQGLVSIEEASDTLRKRRDSLDFDTNELESIEERLHQIFALKRKYGSTIEEILSYREGLAEELRKLDRREEEMERLRTEIASAEGDLLTAAKSLSRKRAKCAAGLSRSVEKELRELGMERGRFEVRLENRDVSPDGIDDVEFLISPNVGESLKPLREIASSGEISRIMLAIKTVLGENDSTPVLIFDEIDVNIGGTTAVTVGERLAGLGDKHQVICITHLPQVARFADTHYRVRKKIDRKRTLTYVDRLTDKERVEELSRMLGASPDEKSGAGLARKMLRKGKEGA